MKKVLSSTIILLTLFLLLVSCESVQEHKGAATGAAVGAGLGATIGAAAAPEGKKAEAAIIGAVVGGIIGGTVGHYAYDVKRTKAETESVYGYNRSQGVRVSIEGVEIQPRSVKPGGRLDTYVTYAVLVPDRATLKIKEVREILYGETLWGRPEVTVERQTGTYRSTLPIFLPVDMKKGTYKLRFILETDYAKDVREAFFTVN